jgi:hypothetical protein
MRATTVPFPQLDLNEAARRFLFALSGLSPTATWSLLNAGGAGPRWLYVAHLRPYGAQRDRVDPVAQVVDARSCVDHHPGGEVCSELVFQPEEMSGIVFVRSRSGFEFYGHDS